MVDSDKMTDENEESYWESLKGHESEEELFSRRCVLVSASRPDVPLGKLEIFTRYNEEDGYKVRDMKVYKRRSMERTWSHKSMDVTEEGWTILLSEAEAGSADQFRVVFNCNSRTQCRVAGIRVSGNLEN